MDMDMLARALAYERDEPSEVTLEHQIHQPPSKNIRIARVKKVTQCAYINGYPLGYSPFLFSIHNQHSTALTA